MLTWDSFLFVVQYTSGPFRKKSQFGHYGGANENFTFVLWKEFPIIYDQVEQKNKLVKPIIQNFQKNMIDEKYESDTGEALAKPTFFFVDVIPKDNTFMI